MMNAPIRRAAHVRTRRRGAPGHRGSCRGAGPQAARIPVMKCGGARRSRARCCRRGSVSHRTTSHCRVRLTSGFSVMQSLRSIQSSGADSADGEEQKDNRYRPCAELLHPVNYPSSFLDPVPCVRSRRTSFQQSAMPFLLLAQAPRECGNPPVRNLRSAFRQDPSALKNNPGDSSFPWIRLHNPYNFRGVLLILSFSRPIWNLSR